MVSNLIRLKFDKSMEPSVAKSTAVESFVKEPIAAMPAVKDLATVEPPFNNSLAVNTPAKELDHIPITEKSSDLDNGEAEDGMLPLDINIPIQHECILVFLAWRSVFEVAEVIENSIKKLSRDLIKTVVRSKTDRLYQTRKHMTPKTSWEQLVQHLEILLGEGSFNKNSALRKEYSDIAESQIYRLDQEISHRIPSCPWGGDKTTDSLVTSEGTESHPELSEPTQTTPPSSTPRRSNRLVTNTSNQVVSNNLESLADKSASLTTQAEPKEKALVDNTDTVSACGP